MRPPLNLPTVIPDGCPAKAGRRSGTHNPGLSPDSACLPERSARMGPGAAACLRRLSGRDDNRTARSGYRKLIPARSTARKIVSGFRDGRHELSPLCPGACGARPRLVGDSIRLRRGHLRGHRQKARPARACRFRDGPARDPGKSPRAGCLGHHHQHFKSDTMSAVHPAPLSYLQGASPWRVLCCFLPISWGGGSPPGGETEGRRVSGVMLMPSSTASPALTRRPLRPLLRQGYGGPTSPHGGEERERGAFPGLVPGPAGVSGGGSSGPRHKAGGSEVCVGEKEAARETLPPAPGPGETGPEKRPTRQLRLAAGRSG